MGAVACGSILGLGDYEIGSDSPIASDGGAAFAGGITVSTTSLAFPEGKCGEKKTLPVVVANTTDAAVPLTVSAPSGITVEGTAPNIPAKGNVTLTIGTSGVDHGTVTLKVGAQSFDLPITAKFVGPRLGLDTTTIDFGEIRHDRKSDPRTLDVENTGDEDVRITGVTAGSDFVLDAPVTVPAHGKATASFTMTAAPAGEPIAASGALATDKPICDPLPPLVFKGLRSPSDVTVSTTSVQAACVGGQQTPVKVSNYGSQQVTVTVTTKPPVNVTPGSFQLAAADSPDTPSTASCSLYGIPPLGDYTYDLVITEGALPPRNVTIGVHVFGAKLQYDTSKILLDAGTTVSRPATNVGNVPVCIHYELAGGDQQSVVAEPDEPFEPNVLGGIEVTGVVIPGAPTHQRFRLRPQAIACAAAAAASPLCAPLPELDVELGN
jgi:hypothetical protein